MQRCVVWSSFSDDILSYAASPFDVQKARTNT